MPENKLNRHRLFYRLSTASVRHRHSGIGFNPEPLVTDDSGSAQLCRRGSSIKNVEKETVFHEFSMLQSHLFNWNTVVGLKKRFQLKTWGRRD
jgi:hypothetical protein